MPRSGRHNLKPIEQRRPMHDIRRLGLTSFHTESHALMLTALLAGKKSKKEFTYPSSLIPTVPVCP